MSPIAEWLTNIFLDFDYVILEYLHDLATKYSYILTPLSKTLEVVGGFPILIMLWIGLAFFLFKKDRKLGLYILTSMAIGFVITNVILKNVFNRPRPYNLDLITNYKEWFDYVKSRIQFDTKSFPSGHTTAMMASITGIFIYSKNKKYSWLLYIFVLLMAASRSYLMVHYPSDVIVGVVVGLVSALIANVVIKRFYIWCDNNQNRKLARYILRIN